MYGGGLGGGDFIASEEAKCLYCSGAQYKPPKILKYGILRMERNSSKISMTSTRKNFLLNNNNPLVEF